MTKYTVTGTKVTFGAGFVLGLSDEQINSRQMQLKKYGKNYQVVSTVEFKKGEVIEIFSKNLTKATLGQLELLEPQKKLSADKPDGDTPNKKDDKKDV